jgi:predicted ATPase with chaperone activity
MNGGLRNGISYDEQLCPAMPETVEDTGLQSNFLADLILKAIHSDTNCTSDRIADKIKLPMGIAEEILQHLYRERLIEIRERSSLQNHRYAMLDRGWERVQRIMQVNGYVGPAPIPLETYSSGIRWMEENRPPVSSEAVACAFSGLVLENSALETLGLVADSRRSLFLTGPAGSGKTTAAKALHAALEGEIWVPYSIEVDGQIIRVYDPHNHCAVEQPAGRYDRRWIKIRRPLIIVGGELTIESMNLIYAPSVNFYEAPFQVKSNGGVLIIDDFGRQRIDPHDLLNRWIIPLETHVDYLTLHTGKKIEVPFQQLLVFATNLNAKDLVDEAFLRRMGYRLSFSSPSVDMYELIFRRYLASHSLEYRPEVLETVLSFYQRDPRIMKACEPRDLIERCLDLCRYRNISPSVTPELLQIAWANYFGSGPSANSTH